jgi:hypothetical protein
VTSEGIRDELVIFDSPVHGRTLAVLPVIPESAPFRVREGIARRRLVAVTGECPCGARMDYEAVRKGVNVAEVEHEGRCPAVTATLAKAVRRWLR